VARITGYGDYELVHERASYLSLPMLIAGFLPWSLVLPFTGAYLWKERKEILQLENAPQLFWLIWVLVFLAVITASTSKRVVYFLPLYPALSALLVFSIFSGEIISRGEVVARKISSDLINALAFFAALGAVVILAVLLLAHPSLFSETLKLKPKDILQVQAALAAFRSHLILTPVLFLASLGLFVAGYRAWKGDLERACWVKALSLLLLIFVVKDFVYPAVARSNSPAQFAKQVSKIVPANEPIFQYKNSFFAFGYYADRRLELVKSANDLRLFPLAYALVEEKNLATFLRELPGAELIAQSETNAADTRGKLFLFRHLKERSGGLVI